MPKIRVLALLVAGVLLQLSCSADTPRFAFNSAERRGVINANGLRFVIMPDPTTQLVEVDVHYEVGSREDPVGKAGLAHLVEHLMFQTRPDGPDTQPIFQTLMDISTFMNAFTNEDMTHYWTTVHAENLDAMLKIEAMRMFYAADLPPFGCSPRSGIATPEQLNFYTTWIKRPSASLKSTLESKSSTPFQR